MDGNCIFLKRKIINKQRRWKFQREILKFLSTAAHLLSSDLDSFLFYYNPTLFLPTTPPKVTIQFILHTSIYKTKKHKNKFFQILYNFNILYSF